MVRVPAPVRRLSGSSWTAVVVAPLTQYIPALQRLPHCRARRPNVVDEGDLLQSCSREGRRDPPAEASRWRTRSARAPPFRLSCLPCRLGELSESIHSVNHVPHHPPLITVGEPGVHGPVGGGPFRSAIGAEK